MQDATQWYKDFDFLPQFFLPSSATMSEQIIDKTIVNEENGQAQQTTIVDSVWGVVGEDGPNYRSVRPSSSQVLIKIDISSLVGLLVRSL